MNPTQFTKNQQSISFNQKYAQKNQLLQHLNNNNNKPTASNTSLPKTTKQNYKSAPLYDKQRLENKKNLPNYYMIPIKKQQRPMRNDTSINNTEKQKTKINDFSKDSKDNNAKQNEIFKKQIPVNNIQKQQCHTVSSNINKEEIKQKNNTILVNKNLQKCTQINSNTSEQSLNTNNLQKKQTKITSNIQFNKKQDLIKSKSSSSTPLSQQPQLRFQTFQIKQQTPKPKQFVPTNTAYPIRRSTQANYNNGIQQKIQSTKKDQGNVIVNNISTFSSKHPQNIPSKQFKFLLNCISKTCDKHQNTSTFSHNVGRSKFKENLQPLHIHRRVQRVTDYDYAQNQIPVLLKSLQEQDSDWQDLQTFAQKQKSQKGSQQISESQPLNFNPQTQVIYKKNFKPLFVTRITPKTYIAKLSQVQFNHRNKINQLYEQNQQQQREQQERDYFFRPYIDRGKQVLRNRIKCHYNTYKKYDKDFNKRSFDQRNKILMDIHEQQRKLFASQYFPRQMRSDQEAMAMVSALIQPNKDANKYCYNCQSKYQNYQKHINQPSHKINVQKSFGYQYCQEQFDKFKETLQKQRSFDGSLENLKLLERMLRFYRQRIQHYEMYPKSWQKHLDREIQTRMKEFQEMIESGDFSGSSEEESLQEWESQSDEQQMDYQEQILNGSTNNQSFGKIRHVSPQHTQANLLKSRINKRFNELQVPRSSSYRKNYNNKKANVPHIRLQNMQSKYNSGQSIEQQETSRQNRAININSQRIFSFNKTE